MKLIDHLRVKVHSGFSGRVHLLDPESSMEYGNFYIDKEALYAQIDDFKKLLSAVGHKKIKLICAPEFIPKDRLARISWSLNEILLRYKPKSLYYGENLEYREFEALFTFLETGKIIHKNMNTLIEKGYLIKDEL